MSGWVDGWVRGHMHHKDDAVWMSLSVLAEKTTPNSCDCQDSKHLLPVLPRTRDRLIVTDWSALTTYLCCGHCRGLPSPVQEGPVRSDPSRTSVYDKVGAGVQTNLEVSQLSINIEPMTSYHDQTSAVSLVKTLSRRTTVAMLCRREI